MQRRPATNAERVVASQRRAIERGAKRLNLMLRPDEVRALRQLQKARYSDTARGVIGKALVEAAQLYMQSKSN